MCNPFMAAGVGAQAVGAANGAKAQKNSLLYDANVADNNAQIADMQAKDAIASGQLEEQAVRMQTAAVKSSQRAAMAANGVALDEGSAVDIQTTTDYMGEMDALTVQDNALRSAWGYRVQATNYRDSAKAARAGASGISSTGAAVGSLLGNAGTVAATWYGMQKAGVGQGGSSRAQPTTPNFSGSSGSSSGYWDITPDNDGWYRPKRGFV